MVYLQVTRGVAPRKHAFPQGRVRPTVIAWARPFNGRTTEEWRAGVACITVADTRWAYCEIKTTGLLPNVLAAEQARRAGAYEAIFVRDGIVTEGAHASAFAVLEGAVWTHPIRNILPGVTRRLVLDLAPAAGLRVREEGVPLARFREAEEIFLTGTTTEVLPVVRLDGRPVGAGVPGPVTLRLWESYLVEVERARR
jgi:D-alanine transaminase